MSTYWTYTNTFYPVVVVLEDIKTSVQTTCTFNIEFVDGLVKLNPARGEEQISNYTQGSLSLSGNSVYATFPKGKKVISVDTSSLPRNLVAVNTKDGSKEVPADGVYVKKKLSTGKGLTEAPA